MMGERRAPGVQHGGEADAGSEMLGVGGDCVCVVGVDQGVKHDGRIYCSDECANRHVKGDGCHHAGCKCHG